MTRKPILTTLVILGSAAVAQAAVVTLLNDPAQNPGTNNPTNVFTVSADGTATTTSITGNSMPTTGSLGGGVTGTFTATWTAEDGGPDGGTGRLPWDAANFIGVLGNGWAWDSGGGTYGPNTPTNTSILIATGEAIRVKFDLSGLALGGQSLRLDGFQVQNGDDIAGPGVFSFNDVSTGTISVVAAAGAGLVTGVDVFQPLNLIIEDGDEVAFHRPTGGGQFRARGFSVSVVPEPSSVAMLGLGLGALCLRRRRTS